MKNFIIAVILSIFLHLIFFLWLSHTKVNTYSPSKQQKEHGKIIQNIKFVKLKKAQPKREITKKKVIKKKPIKKKIKHKIKKKPKKIKHEIKKKPKTKPKAVKKIPKTIEKKALKKVEKKMIKPAKKREIIKKPKKTVPKPIVKKAIQPNFSPAPLPKPKLKPKKKPLDLSSFLAVPQETQIIDEVTKSYLRLYGEEFFTFTKEQKKYLKNNLKNIGQITQRYLKYPRISIRTRQQGMNIVEFMLYPNGDISEVKLLTGSSYRALDKNSVKTIKIAYKDYPKPTEPTKIRIYVYYQLY